MEPLFASPKRSNGFVINPDSLPYSPPIKDMGMYPWNWGSGAQGVTLSPASSCDSPESATDRLLKEKRGRPRADNISNLIMEGARMDSINKCKVCYRVFPREKSLQAHMRTHTGERPYLCDFPNCKKRFAQSGQLKTHQRLHTGEKPFVCSEEGCETRFAHSNRHCPIHPLAMLKKDESSCTASSDVQAEDVGLEVKQWLERHYESKQEGYTPMKQVDVRKRTGIKRSLSQDIENQWLQDKRPALETPCASTLLVSATDAWTMNNKQSQPSCLPSLTQNAPRLVHENVTTTTDKCVHLWQTSPRKRAAEQDRIMGALALIQLAHGKATT